jgi:uncharacterized protein (DUF952 family)
MAIVYKILSRQEWDEALREGEFRGSAVDRRDGFIHFSAAHQVKETARRHFAGQSGLVLVAFDEGVLASGLRWEASRGGDLFPHVYGTIDPRAALHVDELPLEKGGHVFPESLGA